MLKCKLSGLKNAANCLNCLVCPCGTRVCDTSSYPHPSYNYGILQAPYRTTSISLHSMVPTTLVSMEAPKYFKDGGSMVQFRAFCKSKG